MADSFPAAAPYPATYPDAEAALDKKARFGANGSSSPSTGAQAQASPSAQPPVALPQPQASQPYGSVYPNQVASSGFANNPNVAAMAAMLATQQQQTQGSLSPSLNPMAASYGQMMHNGMPGNIAMGGFGPGGFSQQNSPFLGNQGLGAFSPNMSAAGGLSPNPSHQSPYPMGMPSGFGSPNPASFGANFPSPALSQGSFGGVPSSSGSYAQNALQMQQMQQMMSGLGIHQGPAGMNNSNPASAPTGRTVYVGSLPADAAVDELLSQVRFGPIDNVKILPEKNCAFISFLDPTTAAAFHSDALMRKIQLHGQELKIGWGKPSTVSTTVIVACQQNGATRNVYLGNLDESVTEQSLRDDLSRFGPIDQVKVVRDKNIAFVHFLSIATAIKVVQQLAQEPEWAGRKVNYGKDRCAYVPKNQHQQQQHNMAAAAMAATAAGYVGFSNSINGVGMDPSQVQPGNRTVYLGNIHPDTTLEEICNSIRGGILQQIRYIQDKHIAFVTFVDANAALAFFHMASYSGITLHNRRLKVGWGKHSGPPSPGIAMVVQAGGSRNVYIGQIDDFETFNERKIRVDFEAFGEIELVNTLKEKNCAFVNFTNIANSIKAIEGMKQHPEYSNFKIAYGKDRCANPPRNAPWANLLSPNLGNGGSRSAPAHLSSFPGGSPYGSGTASPNHFGGWSPHPASEGFHTPIPSMGPTASPLANGSAPELKSAPATATEA